ncbi:MAG TPA: choice-of-anchor P family protein, partial [Gemmatimonadales bacterium]|nr:choice-of-anchor P family protein [Gemmatimonadales bacterium]
SSATLGAVSLLNGLITTDGVVAIANSTLGDGYVASDAEGSSLANLIVNGTAVSDPAPNSRMDLPGVGYVVLNEQSVTGDGVSTSGITVNMIHVVLQQPILGILGQVIGYQTVGNIIVGSASSSVN